MDIRERKSDLLVTFPERCRRAKLLVTFQRQMVYETLLNFDGHPTADDIYDVVHEKLPQISRSSVFRILDTLSNSGLVAKVMHPGSVTRYDGVADGHSHLVCRKCGTMLDWHNLRFHHSELPPEPPDGFRVEDIILCGYGVCRKCREGDLAMTDALRADGNLTG